MAAALRTLRPSLIPWFPSSTLASSSRLTLHHFTLSPSSSSHSVRTQHNLAQRTNTPSGFEGVPAPGYSGIVKDSAVKGTSHASGETVKDGQAAATAAASSKSSGGATTKRREIKSKKAALSMTPEAVERLRALSSSPTGPKLLRIGVKTRGCAGMAYHLDYVDPPGGRFDEVVEQDGVKVLIDSKALFSIIGSKMDWRDNRLSAGFVFDNPNIVDTCGCGDSFNIR